MRGRSVVALVCTVALSMTGGNDADARRRSHRRSARALAVLSFGGGYYTDTRGHPVHTPVRADRAPDGASARCRDSTYSFSHSRRGTCSRHGGVAEWL